MSVSGPASWADEPAEPVTSEVSVVGKMLCAEYGILLGGSQQTPSVLKKGHTTCSEKAHTIQCGSWYGPVAWQRRGLWSWNVRVAQHDLGSPTPNH